MLADDIAGVLAGGDATAAEVAELLGESERRVSYTLLSTHGRFRRDRATPARWSLVVPATATPGTRPAVGTRSVRAGAGTGPSGRSPMGPEPAGSAPLASGPIAAAPAGLYRWQRDALEAWRRRGRRGVVEAVTGTGKTMLGVAATAEQLQRRGQALVLVPTVELAHQWTAALSRVVPAGRRIGRLGAGRTDTLAGSDVLVAVVNSARSIDVRPIRPSGLLVADECHRYGSAVNRLALDHRFTRRLGLSATYARDDDGNLSWLDPYFGGTCFEMGYRRAIDEGVTAHFAVTLVGVVFEADEQARYDELSDVLGRLQGRLVGGFGLPGEPLEAFLKAVTVLADTDGEGSSVARAYLHAMRERRQLLADTPAKQAGLAGLFPAMVIAERTIVFTQSIAAAERAAAVCSRGGLPAGVIHSGLGAPERRRALDAFAAGRTRMLAAPRILDEGIDVPEADLAVIVGASRSRRQMVQRMGRVLRKKPDGRRARFAVLFVEGTVEDPRRGAHDGFLDQIVDVADHVRFFGAAAVTARPGEVIESISPSVP